MYICVWATNCVLTPCCLSYVFRVHMSVSPYSYGLYSTNTHSSLQTMKYFIAKDVENKLSQLSKMRLSQDFNDL